MPRFLNRLVVVTFLTIVSICVSVQARLTSEEVRRLRSEFVSSTFDDFAESVVFVTGDFEDPSDKTLSEYFEDNEEKKYGIAITPEKEIVIINLWAS